MQRNTNKLEAVDVLGMVTAMALRWAGERMVAPVAKPSAHVGEAVQEAEGQEAEQPLCWDDSKPGGVQEAELQVQAQEPAAKARQADK